MNREIQAVGLDIGTSKVRCVIGEAADGGVMNIVTKSGTNNLSGSFFESFRDKSMNARTETEKIANTDKQDYRRNQFGGSLGGPILKDKAHYFAAYERTQQDTTQTVNTKGLLPTLDGSYGVPEGIISSFPVTCSGGDYTIVEGLDIDDYSRGKIDASAAELVEERDAVKELGLV